LNEWIIKIDPNLLNSEPVINDSGKKGWSEQSRWYYYRTLGLINQGQTNDALVLIDYALEHFPGQSKFFQKIKAEAYCNLGNLDEAEKIYKNICNSKKVDWWILHRYSQLFIVKGSKEDALRLMCQAASMNSKLDVMVTLFADIGKLCSELKMIEEARAHLSLCRYIREQKGWSKSELLLTIDDLNKIIGNNNEPTNLKDALQICKSFWEKQLSSERISIDKYKEERRTRYNLSGMYVFSCRESVDGCWFLFLRV
jgi:tetratricopeptide (TPR) repeat protein